MSILYLLISFFMVNNASTFGEREVYLRFISDNQTEYVFYDDGTYTQYCDLEDYSDNYVSGHYDYYVGDEAVELMSEASETGQSILTLKNAFQKMGHDYYIGKIAGDEANASETYELTTDEFILIYLEDQVIHTNHHKEKKESLDLFGGFYIAELDMYDLNNFSTQESERWIGN